MRLFGKPALLLSVGLAFAAVLILLGLLGGTSPAFAQGAELESTELAGQVQVQQPSSPQIAARVVFTDPAIITIQDLAGNSIGEGRHTGELRCKNGNCNRNTQLVFTNSTTGIKYQFSSLQAIDQDAERLVVAGVGTISSAPPQKERFLFTATFENNGDGTVRVTYVASRPDASFLIPSSPGTFTIYSRP